MNYIFRTQKQRVSGRGIWLLTLLVLVLGVAGVVLYKHANRPNPNARQVARPAPHAREPTTGGPSGYVDVPEWGVRLPVPADLRGKLTYRLTDIVVDPDGIRLQAAKLLVASGAAVHHCVEQSSALGPAVDTGIQYIRAESDKRLNIARYNGVFQQNILQAHSFNISLNYVTPDCLNTPLIQELQHTAVLLETIQ